MATDRSRDETMAAFVGHLRRLKTEGCNLLVVGEGPERLFARASSQMLGDGETRRYRALAVTEGSAAVARRRLPDAADSLADTTAIVTQDEFTRSAAVDETEAAVERGRTSADELPPVPERRVESGGLAALRDELDDAISAFDARADGLSPAQLRVGVDSLAPLADRHDEAELRRFLRLLGERVREYDGMAHYVLAEPYESDRVQRLAPDFDAVVELRTTGDAAGQERWHLPDEDVTMPWLPL